MLLFIASLAQAQNFTVSGYVTDSESGESLIGATIIDQNSGKGTVSNTFGFYSLTLPKGQLNLKISFVAYQPIEELVELNSSKQISYQLKLGSQLDEVVVTAEENIELQPQMSTIDVPVEQIKAMPVLMGEADVLKSIQLLPGIQSGMEGTSGIYVRGGGADQNLILLDGVPVYNVSHLFGFFSVFNPDAINQISVMKGGFPARYGGRLSSVIDISMKDGNNQKFQGEGSIGLISSKLTLEGPIGKNEKTSFIVSGRRTYIDLLTRPLIKASSGGTGGYYFYDFNAKISHRISEKDRIFLSAYNGKDRGFGSQRNVEKDQETLTKYIYENESGLSWGNTIAAFRWNHIFTPKVFSNITTTYSRYNFRVFQEHHTDSIGLFNSKSNHDLVEYFSGIDDFSLKVDVDFLPSPSHNIKFGSSATHHTFNPGIYGYNTNIEGENDTTSGGDRTTALEWLAYLEDDFSIGSRLRMNTGIHYSGFLVNSKYYQSIQPRISGRLLITSKLAAKASFATMTQYIHLLTNSGLGLPTDLWVPTTKQIRPEQSWQGAFGLAQTFKGYEVSLEGYYKEMNDLIEYKEGASYFDLGADWQDKVAIGQGKSYGAELLIQKKTGRLSGWAGYTLSWTKRQFDELNYGNWFPYKYDRRHDLSVVGVYAFSPRLSFSGTWVYSTGATANIPLSVYEEHEEGNTDYTPSVQYNSLGGGFVVNSGSSFGWDNYSYDQGQVNNYPKRNNYRMADYHRLDLGFTWKKEKTWGEATWSFGAYNIYNRKNPFFMDIKNTWDGRAKLIQYSLFPVLPYVKYGFTF